MLLNCSVKLSFRIHWVSHSRLLEHPRPDNNVIATRSFYEGEIYRNPELLIYKFEVQTNSKLIRNRYSWKTRD